MKQQLQFLEMLILVRQMVVMQIFGSWLMQLTQSQEKQVLRQRYQAKVILIAYVLK